MGELIVNKVTYNSIFVTWRISRCQSSSGTLKSPSFILVTPGYPVSFSLSLACAVESTLTVEKTGSQIGRGIVSLGIRKGTKGATMKMCLNEKWKQSCSFNEIITLSDHWSTEWTINCKITWLGFIDDLPSPEYPPVLFSVKSVEYDNTLFPDFTIIAEGQEIPSHKAILAGHSPVFLTMFETPMIESEENKVTVEDIEYSTMEILLKIMYTGKTEDLNDIDTALKVLQAAVKYEMSRIKILCEYSLQRKIQVDNVFMLLAEADKYNAALLCEACVAYIFAVDDIKIKEEFYKISRKPNIGFAVMDTFMDQIFTIPCKKNE